MIEEIYSPDPDRYNSAMNYRRSGQSGILLPEISLGLWQNFGDTAPYSRSKEIVLHAFDRGITSFDLANNYGPPYGTAETTFGRIMREALHPYRDELFISTKAGYDMWPGPYGNWGSRKYLFASLDQSLHRMGLDYVDIFYSHRYDPNTPLRETLQALVDIVRCGKALYAGISRWPLEAMKYAAEYLSERDTPCLLFQDRLNIFDRGSIQSGILEFVRDNGIGFIGFSPLAQGLLTNRYINGIPEGSRAARGSHLTADNITAETVSRIRRLNDLAQRRGQTLAQMSTAWVLAHEGVASVIVGCSSREQLDDTLQATSCSRFSAEELSEIDSVALH